METKQKVNLSIAVPLIMIFGIPFPFIIGFFAALLTIIIIAIGLGILSAIIGFDFNEELFKPIGAVLFACYFLYFYWAIIQRSVDAIKEGEGLLYALYIGIFEPVLEILRNWR